MICSYLGCFFGLLMLAAGSVGLLTSRVELGQCKVNAGTDWNCDKLQRSCPYPTFTRGAFIKLTWGLSVQCAEFAVRRSYPAASSCDQAGCMEIAAKVLSGGETFSCGIDQDAVCSIGDAQYWPKISAIIGVIILSLSLLLCCLRCNLVPCARGRSVGNKGDVPDASYARMQDIASN